MEKMLQQKIKGEAIAKKQEEMQAQLRHQIMMEDMGKKPEEIIDESLNNFAQAKEFEDLADTLGEMMVKQDEQKQKSKEQVQRQRQMVDEEIEKTNLKYGRVMTPKTSQMSAADPSSKRFGI